MDDMKIYLLNKTKSFLFHFFRESITLILFFSSSEHIFLCMFWRKQGYVTNFARKTEVSNYISWRLKQKRLSRLLVQRINEFKINEIQRKTPELI